MQTEPIERREVLALLYRARLGMVFRALAEPEAAESTTFELFKSHAKALADVLEGGGKGWADKDDRLGGYETYGVFQAAVTRLPDGFERLTLAEVRQCLTAQGVVLGTDAVSDSQIDGAVQLVDSVRPIIQVDDKHAISLVDSDDSSLDSHASSHLTGAIVAQGGAA